MLNTYARGAFAATVAFLTLACAPDVPQPIVCASVDSCPVESANGCQVPFCDDAGLCAFQKLSAVGCASSGGLCSDGVCATDGGAL